MIQDLILTYGQISYDSVDFLFNIKPTIHASIVIINNGNKARYIVTVRTYTRSYFWIESNMSFLKECAHTWYYHLLCKLANIVFDCLLRDSCSAPITNLDLILSSTQESIDHNLGFH